MKAKAQKEKPRKAGPRDQGRVLIVSDEPESVDYDPLTSAGLEIVGVCRGAAALITLQRLRPHVVVASSTIKGISTAELARMLGQT